MPLIMILRFFLSLFSLMILAVTGYLLWSWYQGDFVRDGNGVLIHVRENWRLWLGLALGAWSFGGGLVVLKPLLARRDQGPIKFARGAGEIINGVNGASLYLETIGATDAPTLIFTHGWGLDSTIWAAAKRDLSESCRVITWDLPSMGLSKAPNAAVSLESFADNLAVVIKHSGAERVILIGHSIGGMTTQTLARDHKALFDRHVAGVVLVNTTYINPLQTMILSKLALALRFPMIEPQMHLTMWLWPLAWLSAWKSYLDGSAHIANRLGFGADVTQSQLNHTTLLSTRNPQSPQAKGNLAMFGWNATGSLGDIKVPVLALGGDADLLTRPEASADIAASTPKGRVEIFKGAGHMGFVEQSSNYNRAIAHFVATTIAADTSRFTPQDNRKYGA